MELEATIRVPGAVYRLGEDRSPMPDEVCVSAEAGKDVLWINGLERGWVIVMRPHVKCIYEAGNPVPVDVIVTETQIDCVIEL